MEKIIEGVTVAYSNETKKIFWSDCWERIPELKEKGYLRSECYGPSTYGHIDYFVK